LIANTINDGVVVDEFDSHIVSSWNNALFPRDRINLMLSDILSAVAARVKSSSEYLTAQPFEKKRRPFEQLISVYPL
jgi:calcineurin-like phosphoesterase family protein